MDYLVSVFTCVYNGEKTIHRVFDSLKNQKYKNIEHIIVNDGSTDNTAQLIKKYMSEVDYPVKYFEKENGGKHTATNIAWDNSEGYFIFQLDADDEIMPDALDFLVETYRKIPECQKDEYWCILGRCIDQVNRQLIGVPYPDDINFIPAAQAKKISANIAGDKVGIMKRERIGNCRYPVPNGVSFVTESYVWHPLVKKYRTYYTNEVVLLHYINERESLSNPKITHQICSNYAYFLKYELSNCREFDFGFKKTLNKFLFYIVYRGMATKEYKKSHPYFLKNNDWLMNFALFMLAVPGRLASFYFEKKWKVSN